MERFETSLLRIIVGKSGEVIAARGNCIVRNLIICTILLTICFKIIKSRNMRWVEHVASMGEVRKWRKILVEMPEWKGPVGRPRRRTEDRGRACTVSGG
jgi:hypothetical protein